MSPGGAGGGGQTMTWHEEIASLVEDTGIQYPAGVEAPAPAEAGDPRARVFGEGYYGYEDGASPVEESLKDQVKGFLVATGEMLQELGRGCRDIVQQSLEGAEDTYVVKKLRGPLAVVSSRLSFLNEYLPEDRDPMHAWPVVICVFLLALIGNNACSFFFFFWFERINSWFFDGVWFEFALPRCSFFNVNLASA